MVILYRRFSFTEDCPLPTILLYRRFSFTDDYPLPTIILYRRLSFTDDYPLPTIILYRSGVQISTTFFLLGMRLHLGKKKEGNLRFLFTVLMYQLQLHIYVKIFRLVVLPHLKSRKTGSSVPSTARALLGPEGL